MAKVNFKSVQIAESGGHTYTTEALASESNIFHRIISQLG